MFTLNNVSHPISNEEDNRSGRWVLLAPFGDHPHEKGIQRVDARSVATMIRRFHSLWGRIKRAFVGRSIYLGHPDAMADVTSGTGAGTQKGRDPQVYGVIADLEGRKEGLYARILLTEEGADLVNWGVNCLSPYWVAERCEEENGEVYFRPVELISAGLTNRPNIRAESLSNSRENATPGEIGSSGTFIKTKAITANLRAGYPGLGEKHLNREEIRHIVQEKCAQGSSYDEAFENFFR